MPKKELEILKLIRRTTRKDLIPLRNKGGVHKGCDVKEAKFGYDKKGKERKFFAFTSQKVT